MRDSFYIPLIGGARDRNIELISVSQPGDLGSVDIIGDVIRFEAGPGLTGFPIGVPVPVLIPVQFRDGDGKLIDTVIPITALNTAVGVQLVLPGGRTVIDKAVLSPLPLGDQVTEPFTIETDPFAPIFVDESILVDRFNEENPQFLEAFLQAQSDLTKAVVAKSQADQAVADAAAALELLGAAADARAIAEAQRAVADAQAEILTTLLADLNAAFLAVSNAVLDLAQAQEEFDIAAAQVLGLASQVQVFQDAIVPSAALAFAEADAALTIQLAIFGLSPPAEDHFDIPGIGPIIEVLADERQAKLDALTEAQETLADLQEDLDAAALEQNEALVALTAATGALAAAETALAEFEGVDFEALEASVQALDIQATASELAADQFEAAAAQALGVDVPVSEDTLAEFATALNAALQDQVTATVALTDAELALQSAAEIYQAQLDALPDVEFDLAIFDLGLAAEISAGLEFHFNPATETDPRELALMLAYDLEFQFDINALLVIPDVFLGIDQEVPIVADVTRELSGRVELDLAQPAERFDPTDRSLNSDLGERFAAWSDSFDFV